MKKYISKIQFLIDYFNQIGEVYIVGGAVRDHHMDVKPVDIDLLITGVPLDDIITYLEKRGEVKQVGKKFGVIKFKYCRVEYDIALPRIDIKVGAGHKGFEIISNHNISISEDLKRRDVTFNAMAWSTKTESLVDPFNGLQDITDKVIRAVSLDVLIEDPLRIMRIFQFAARTSFNVDGETYRLIKENIHLLKEIHPTRIYSEIKKVFDKKGDYALFKHLLHDSGFVSLYFPKVDATIYDMSVIKPKYMGEFLIGLFGLAPIDLLEKELNILKEDSRIIGLYKKIYKGKSFYEADVYQQMYFLYKLVYSNQQINLLFMPDVFKKAYEYLCEPRLPKTHAKLGINYQKVWQERGTDADKVVKELIITKWKEVMDQNIIEDYIQLIDAGLAYHKLLGKGRFKLRFDTMAGMGNINFPQLPDDAQMEAIRKHVTDAGHVINCSCAKHNDVFPPFKEFNVEIKINHNHGN